LATQKTFKEELQAAAAPAPVDGATPVDTLAVKAAPMAALVK
jgi:hypothetical protein